MTGSGFSFLVEDKGFEPSASALRTVSTKKGGVCQFYFLFRPESALRIAFAENLGDRFFQFIEVGGLDHVGI